MAGVPERGYQSQLGPAAATPFAGASPEAFGAGLGAAVGQLGQTLHQADVNAYKLDLERQKASEVSDVGVQLARLRAAAPAQIQQLRDQAPADGSGHVAQVDDWLKGQTDQILGNVRNTEVANHFRPVVEEMRASLVGDETAWAHAQRAEHLVLNGDDTARTLANQEATSPSDNVGDSLNLFATTVRGLGLDANATDKAVRDGQRQIAVAHLQGRTDTGHPQATLALIDSGVFNKYLDPGDIKTLRSAADTEIRRQQVEARQAVEQRVSDAAAFIDNIGKRVDNHIPVPASDFQQASHLLADPDLAPRLKGHAFDVGKWEAVDSVNRQYQNATPQTIAARVDALNAEIANRGDKVDPAHVIERNTLAAMLPQRRQELNDDPLALYARSGGEVTPLVSSDPASIQARYGQWKKAQAQLGPTTGPLLRDEVDRYTQELAQGNTAGRIALVNELSNFPHDMAVAAARQVAPGNQHLQTAAALAAMGRYGMTVARDSLYGADAIAAHRGIINEKAFGSVFSQAAQALTGLAPDAQHGIYDTAMGVTATRLARAGQVGPWPSGVLGVGQDGYQRKIASVAINEALGGSKRPDGSYAGGIGTHAGAPTLLPTTMTQAEFDNAFYHATPEDFVRAAGGVTPIYANGHPPTWKEFMGLRLQAVGDGIYRVLIGNTALLRNDGRGNYEFDANKLTHGR